MTNEMRNEIKNKARSRSKKSVLEYAVCGLRYEKKDQRARF
jgi:hypothetical protein